MSKTFAKLIAAIDGAKVNAHTRESCKRGMHAALDYLATESKKQVPLDKGPLKNSCYIDVATDGKSGTVSYDTKYAVRQHEERRYHHQRGRKAKYLEDPVYDPNVRKKMRELMKKEAQF